MAGVAAGSTGEVERLLQRALADRPATPLQTPVRLPSAADEVTDRLLSAVALGEFVPGERLPVERDLSRLLGVSRSTVREAMGRLRAAGIVEIRRGRSGGSYVLDSWSAPTAEAVRRTLLPRWADLQQLFDLRELVEGMIAAVAAERRTPEQAADLERALAAFRAASTPEEEHAADTAIHRAVVRATGNPQVAALSQDLLTRVSLGFPIEPYRREVYQRALREHRALVAAVVAGDPEAAARAARKHFSLTAENLRRALTRSLGD